MTTTIPLLPADERERARRYLRTYYKRHTARALKRAADWRRANQRKNRAILPELKRLQAEDKTPRRCPVCEADKTLADFNLDTAMADGFDSICRVCRKVLKKGYAKRKEERRGETDAGADQGHPATDRPPL